MVRDKGTCRACGENVTWEWEERDGDLGIGERRICPECGEGNGTPMEPDNPLRNNLP